MRFSSLGDILLTAPAVRALRRRFPFAEIEFLVKAEYADAATLIPNIDRIVPVSAEQLAQPLRLLKTVMNSDYSLIVDLQNSPRSSFLRAFSFPPFWVKAQRYRLRRTLLILLKRDYYKTMRPVPLRYLDALDPLGCVDDEQGLELTPPQASQLPAYDIVLCPGAKHFTKRWPAENWSELARQLTVRGHTVAVVGAAGETKLCSDIAAASEARVYTELTVPHVAALMAQAKAVVSNDSGLMHLAAGLNIPLVAIFGPTVEQFGFFPFRARAIIHEHSLSCRPCSAFGGERCPKQHFDCMLKTPPQAVLESVDRLLALR